MKPEFLIKDLMSLIRSMPAGYAAFFLPRQRAGRGQQGRDGPATGEKKTQNSPRSWPASITLSAVSMFPGIAELNPGLP